MTRRPDHVQSKPSRRLVGEMFGASAMFASAMSAVPVGILGALIDYPP